MRNNDVELKQILFQFTSILFLIILVSSCEDPGSVGQQFSNNDANLATDTVLIDSLSSLRVSAISGNKPFVTAGIYDDPLFGRFNATALIRPGIASSVTDTIAPDATVTRIQLKLKFNKKNIWGDTTSTTNFKIYEIGESWDETTWRYDDEPKLSDRILGEFSVTNEDSILISIERDWIEEYARVFNLEDATRDSVFNNNIFGFGIVAENNSKLSPIRVSDSRLNIITTTLPDTLSIPILDEATSLKRDQRIIATKTAFELNSTYNNAVFFDFDEFVNDINSPALSAANMVIKQQDSLLSASLPENHIRPVLNETRSFLRSSDDAVSLLETSSSIGLAFTRINDESVLVSNFTNDFDQIFLDNSIQTNLFIIYGLNNGIISSSLYYGAANNAFSPRFIITSLQP